MNLEIYLQPSAAAMADREKKKGRNVHKHMNYSERKDLFS